MKTLSCKECKECAQIFEFESWNTKRQFCSRACKDTHGRGSKISTHDWIHRARMVHGDRFDYSDTNLDAKIDNKVAIKCSIHGTFFQNSSQHLLGKGCKKCAQEKQFLTTAEFIQKSNIKHRDKYTYQFTVYKSMREYVTITCMKHGNFLQSPTQHLHHGAGCPICAQVYTSSKGENEWLDSLGIEHRQIKIIIGDRHFIVDGIKDKIIYEYLGDYWHGNPSVFDHSDRNELIDETFGELYEKTFNRFEILKTNGYEIKYIWESEWNQKK